MSALEQSVWRAEFARKATLSREQRLRIEAEQQVREQRKKDDEAQDRSEAAGEVVDAIVLASDADIDAFTIELDRYDAATVEALTLNEEQLGRARERIEGLLLRAQVLPDGRRVFETEDGLRVFDEFGAEIGSDVISADDIDDRRPRWETFQAARSGEAELLEQRRELLDYQAQLDEMRERLEAGGDFTADELKEMRVDTAANAPASVREILDRQEGREPQQPVAEPTVNAAQAIDLDAMRQSLTASGFQPQ